MYLQRFLRPISSYGEIGDLTSMHYNISSNTAAKPLNDPGRNMNMAGKGKLSKKTNTRKRVFTKGKRKKAPQVQEYEDELPESNSVLQIPRELSDVYALNLAPVKNSKEDSLQAQNEEELDETLKIVLAENASERIPFPEDDVEELNQDGRKSWFDRPRRFSDSYIVNLTSARKFKPPEAYTDDELSETLRVMLEKRFPGKPIPDLRIREPPELKKIKQIYSNNVFEVSPGLVKLLEKMRLLNSKSGKGKEASSQANTEGDSSETSKVIPSKKYARKGKEESQVGKGKQDMQKRTQVALPSTKISKLRSGKLTASTKTMEPLPEASNEEDLCETPKVIPTRKSPRVRKEVSQVGKGKQDAQKRTSVELPSTSTKKARNLRSGNVTAPPKRRETLPQADNEDLCETPNVNKRPRRKILEKDLQKKRPKSQATVDSKLKRKNAAKLSTSNNDRSKKNSRSTLPSTILAEHSTEQMHVTKSGENTRAHPLTIPEEDSDVSLDSAVMSVGEHSKKTARTKSTKRRINPKKRKAYQDELEEEMVSAASPSGSTKDFIVSSESEESTSAPSLSSFESDSDESLDGIYMYSQSRNTPAPKSVKRKRKSKEREAYKAALEKEMREIPKYASSLFEDSLDSNSSSYRFLEEIGMLESDASLSSVESRFSQKKNKLGKKKSPKKKVSEDSWENKSLSEKLREYDEYLKSISVCDLSLKRWRV